MSRLTGKNSQRGNILVVVLIAAAITGIISMAIASVFSSLIAAQNTTKFRSQVDNFAEEIRALLSSPAACLNSLGGVILDNSTDVSLINLKDGSASPGVVKYDLTTVYGDNSLHISSIKFTLYKDDLPPKGQATLFLVFLANQRGLGPQIVQRSIQIATERDPTNKLSSCIALSKMSDGIWQRQATNLNNIFFQPSGTPPAGNVGIGTSTPTARLTVSTNTALQNAPLDTVAQFIGADGGPARIVLDSHTGVTAYGSNVTLRTSRGTAAAPSALFLNDALGGFSYWGYGATGYSNDRRAQIAAFASENWNDLAQGTYLSFLTTIKGNAAISEKMRITDSGNVGIGITSPINLLHIQSRDTDGLGNGISLQASPSNFIPAALILRNSASVEIGEIGAATQGGQFSNDALPGDIILRSKSGRILLANDPLGNLAWPTRLTLDLSGNVGIGTTTPATFLEVVGAKTGLGQSNDRGAIFRVTDGIGRIPLEVGGGIDGSAFLTGAASALKVRNVSGTGLAINATGHSVFAGDITIGGCLNYGGGSMGTCLSDRRLKTDVTPFDLGLSVLLGLRPVEFRYNGFANHPVDSKPRVGVIADEVKSIAPTLVESTSARLNEASNETTRVLAVKYGSFLYVVINAIKELYAKFLDDHRRIEELERKNLVLIDWICAKDPSAAPCSDSH